MSDKPAYKAPAATGRLANFPVSFFAVIMGLSGFTLAWRAAGSAISPQIAYWLGGLTSLTMLVIICFYALKAIRHLDAVVAETHHPIKLNFFPAFSISLLLLAAIWQEYHPLAHALWCIGAVIQLSLTLFVMSSWIHRTHYTLSHANPSWFIPVVGNIIVPIAGAELGYTEVSWFFFSIGIVFWIVLLTVVMYRLFFHEPLPARLTPMLFILLAPPSVGFVSYSNLIGGIDTFGRVLYYIALFLSMLLFSNIVRFIKVPFFISSWAYSFPLAALTVATAKMANYLHSTFLHSLASLLLFLVTLLLAWLCYKTLKAAFNKQLCLPE